LTDWSEDQINLLLFFAKSKIIIFFSLFLNLLLLLQVFPPKWKSISTFDDYFLLNRLIFAKDTIHDWAVCSILIYLC